MENFRNINPVKVDKTIISLEKGNYLLRFSI
jgi:hypothetical protein